MNAITTDKTAANVIPITPAQALDELCEQWVAAKRAENEANARRVQIEALIITVTGCKEEGSETTTTPAGRKVTVTGKLSYSADIDELVKLAARLPENMRPVKYEPTLDSTGVKFLRTREPDMYAVIAPAITVKPAKPSVAIKEA